MENSIYPPPCAVSPPTCGLIRHAPAVHFTEAPAVSGGEFTLLSLWCKPFSRKIGIIELKTNKFIHSNPVVTVVVPSYNQGRFLDAALSSIFEQEIPVEVFVLDGGSTDNSVDVIKSWAKYLAGWRSSPDNGQAWAINEGIKKGTAPYVCWLNSDDFFLPDGLRSLLDVMASSPGIPAVYGKCWNVSPTGHKTYPYPTAPFWPALLANYCFIAQPATLIRRSAWEKAGGLDVDLHMALDYELWWRLYRQGGRLKYVRKFIASNRRHAATKTTRQRERHYREAMLVVNRHYGKIPAKWYLAWPLMVNVRQFFT